MTSNIDRLLQDLQKNPGMVNDKSIATKYHLTPDEVKLLTKIQNQCKGLKGEELKERISTVSPP